MNKKLRPGVMPTAKKSKSKKTNSGMAKLASVSSPIKKKKQMY